MEQPDVVGIQPSIESRICESILCQEFWWAGALEEAANVVFMQFDGAWHRLYIDGGVVFWRTADGPPERKPEPDYEGELRISDMGQILGLEASDSSRLKHLRWSAGRRSLCPLRAGTSS